MHAETTASGAYRWRDLWNVPGCLSLSRVAFAFVFPCVVDRPWLALATVGAAAISDVLDGFFARRSGMSSATGAALDPLTDKIFAISVMVTLVVGHRLTVIDALLLSSRELGELPLVAFVALARRPRMIRAAGLGSNPAGKVTTVLQCVALVGVLFGASSVRTWIGATAIVGIFAASSYWWRFLAAARQHTRATGAN